MVIIFAKSFCKKHEKLNTQLQKKLSARLNIFQNDRTNIVLNEHKLHGKWKCHKSINVTGDIRAIFREEGETVIFVAIGSHGELYQ